MMKNLKSEEGSVVLLALMVLVLITMFGFAALNTADTELLVAHNSRCYKQNLYRAEAMIMEAAQALALQASTPANLDPNTSALPWLIDLTLKPEPDYLPEEEDWADMPVGVSAVPNYANNANYIVGYEGLAPGSSYDMNAPIHTWQYSIYGKSDLCSGELGVVAGYRTDF